jgi:hypothetical protein
LDLLLKGKYAAIKSPYKELLDIMDPLE